MDDGIAAIAGVIYGITARNCDGSQVLAINNGIVLDASYRTWDGDVGQVVDVVECVFADGGNAAGNSGVLTCHNQLIVGGLDDSITAIARVKCGVPRLYCNGTESRTIGEHIVGDGGNR